MSVNKPATVSVDPLLSTCVAPSIRGSGIGIVKARNSSGKSAARAASRPKNSRNPPTHETTRSGHQNVQGPLQRSRACGQAPPQREPQPHEHKADSTERSEPD